MIEFRLRREIGKLDIFSRRLDYWSSKRKIKSIKYNKFIFLKSNQIWGFNEN
jgi:hypothetical protein